MSERTYTTVDKSEWGDGPWQDEPDKVQWVDETTGLPCLAVRNRHGAWCGYAGVSDGHPWFGAAYNGPDGDHGQDSPAEIVEVHGGLSYADACEDGAPEASGICHVPEPGGPHHVWWFGFDCAHFCDVLPGMMARERALGMPLPPDAASAYRTLDYVRAEVASLAKQLAAREA